MYLNILEKVRNTFKISGVVLGLSVAMWLFHSQPSVAADVTFVNSGDGIEVELFYGVNPDNGKSYVEPEQQKVTVYYVENITEKSQEFYLLPEEYLVLENVEGGKITRDFPDSLYVEITEGALSGKIIHKKFSGGVLKTIENVKPYAVAFQALSADYFTNVDGNKQEIAPASETTFEQLSDGIPRLVFMMTGGESTPPTEYNIGADPVGDPPSIPNPDGSADLDEGSLVPDKNQVNGDSPDYSKWQNAWSCRLSLEQSTRSSNNFMIFIGIFVGIQAVWRLIRCRLFIK